MNGIRRFSGAIVLIGLLAAPGCTKAVLLQGYKNADTLIFMRTDSYFDLRKDQEHTLKHTIDNHLRWHRKEELPLVAAWLREIEKRTQRGFHQDDLAWFEASALAMRDRVLNRIEPDSVDFLATVDQAQMVHFREQFNKDSREIIKELTMSPAEKAKLRAKRLIDFTEFFTGALAADQKAAAQKIGEKLPDTLPLRLAYRAHGMAELERLVREKADRKKIREFLRSYWLLPGSKPDPVARQFSLQSWVSFRTGMKEMDSLLTPQQRLTACKRLLELASDLEKISRETR